MTKTIRWLWQVPGRKKGWVLALTMLQALAGGTGAFYALLLKNVVDSAVAGSLSSLRQNVIYLIGLVLVLIVLDAVLNRLYEQTQADFENLFKKRLTDNILRKDYAAVQAVHSGEWMTRLTGDTVVVAGNYVELVPGLVGTVIRLIFALAMIIALDRWFAWVLLPGGAAVICLAYVFRRVLKRLHKNIQESDGRLRSFLQERIGSLMVIKAFSAESQTGGDAWERMQEHKAARMKRNAFSILCSIGFNGAMQGMYLVGVVYCAYGIHFGTVTYGTLTAIMQLIGQVQAPFARLSGFVSRFYAMTASAERLMEAETFSDDGSEPVLDAKQVHDYYTEVFLALALRKMAFTFPSPAELLDGRKKEDMPVVLQGMDLEIHKGEYVAFIGHSGCGKSTVLKLLMCLYSPDEGERILVGRDGSVPLTAKWRRLFAYVPQGNALMSGRLVDVVSFARPEHSGDKERVRQTLAIACADEFVSDLEKGLDTELGEHGASLSEGQMQRLAIARAVFSDAPILLLDEATSALDEETEKRLLCNLRRLTDKTVIFVTHRKAALSICDRVLMFAEDGVREAASPEVPGTGEMPEMDISSERR